MLIAVESATPFIAGRVTSHGGDAGVAWAIQPASKHAQQPGRCLQGAKVLVVGSAPSFFTIFPVITGLALKVLQLDRAGALEPGSEQLQLAAAAAAEASDCVLVTEQQLQGALFPLNRQASTSKAC